MTAGKVSSGDLSAIDAYWRAANYLSVGQIYLYDNPLLEQPLTVDHIKPRLLGHWGTTPGLNFIYAHLNRIICERDQDMIFITGPGHGGPALVANTYLEGSYTTLYPHVTQDARGMKRLFKQFSFPGGVPSHVAAETPGSIHEGGELGYSLSHAFGAAFDNPGLVVACVIGDGEAETGPLASAWDGNKFLNPKTDGAVLPILHLNGYKIANPSVMARIPESDLLSLISGHGYEPFVVDAYDTNSAHESFAETLDICFDKIEAIQAEGEGRWPAIVLKSPKGWTGPREVDGKQIEDTWRAHQVPLEDFRKKPEHVALLESWLRSYRPDELFDRDGKPSEILGRYVPGGEKRMGLNPHANGGLLRKALAIPDLRHFQVEVKQPGGSNGEATRALGKFLGEVFRLNESARNFRLFGPDETESNRLTSVYDETDKVFQGKLLKSDEHLAPYGRVLEILSEHQCQGWLEGYLLTGRHGLFSCYEAFIHIVDSMLNQHAKWLHVCRDLPWRAPISSLNYLLTSHVWRQDHNGNSHQDPGFLDHVANKSSDIVRIYLPCDANTLLCVANQCLDTVNRINVIVAGKQPQPQWLNFDDAVTHCESGIGVWQWASYQGEPDIVMACAGDVPTIETMAAVDLLKSKMPSLKVRVVNVVDLMTLQSPAHHPHGISDETFQKMFTAEKPIVFAFHGYPSLIHRLTYKRPNHHNVHVHGYRGYGTTTTPFDMVVINELDRFHLALNAVNRSDLPSEAKTQFSSYVDKKLDEHREHVTTEGEDLPEILAWKWQGK